MLTEDQRRMQMIQHLRDHLSTQCTNQPLVIVFGAAMEFACYVGIELAKLQKEDAVNCLEQYTQLIRTEMQKQ